MRADLRALFDDADGDLLPLFLGKLTQPDRGRQTRRPRADDNHVKFHRFPLYRLCHVFLCHVFAP